MGDLTRRSVVKGIARGTLIIAAAPIIPTISGCCADNWSITLNVALHGLFVLNVVDTGIELLTPEVEGHIYRAGSWDADKTSCLDLKGVYELTGVERPDEMPGFDTAASPILSQARDGFSVNESESRFKVILPFPMELHFLRCIANSPDCSKTELRKPPCGEKCKSIEITKVSLCQVLTYKVDDWRKLKLGDKWIPNPEHIDQRLHTTNLHLWAEPARRLTPMHADDAYSRLSSLVPPLNLMLRVYATPPIDRYTGVCGFPPAQEQGWSDWASGGGEGTHPTNCCAVMTTK